MRLGGTGLRVSSTFLDTSDVYPIGGNLGTVGRTEEIIGRWLAGRRHDFIIATKCFGAVSARAWDQGLSRKHILDAIEGSLRRLGTDYVDLYQLHHPDPSTPMDESLRALDDIVRAGKARYVGCSNYFAYQIARALGRSEHLGLARFDCVQPRYNLLFRQVERELFPLCAEEGLGGSRTTRSRAACSPASIAARPARCRARALHTLRPARATAIATGASSRPSRRSGRSPRKRACR